MTTTTTTSGVTPPIQEPQTLADIRKMSVSEIAALPPATLMVLQADARSFKTDIESLAARLGDALLQKYRMALDACHRHQYGGGAGTVVLKDDLITVSADYSLQIDWDQKQLARFAKRLIRSGDDPADYLDITYRIDESVYRQWTDHLKASVFNARHAYVDTPSITLTWSGDDGQDG